MPLVSTADALVRYVTIHLRVRRFWQATHDAHVAEACRWYALKRKDKLMICLSGTGGREPLTADSWFHVTETRQFM